VRERGGDDTVATARTLANADSIRGTMHSAKRFCSKTRVPQLMRSEVVRKVVVSRCFDMPNRCSACI